jgi:L-histidine Nalpha-methyltransferase
MTSQSPLSTDSSSAALAGPLGESLPGTAVPPSVNLASHVMEGLSATQKYLASSWFYDDEGSRIFQDIMGLPEYYLTRCEHEILQQRGAELVQWISPQGQAIRLIELGSGDGAKTLSLCRHLLEQGITETYYPMDISQHALNELQARFERELPAMAVQPVLGDYFVSWPQQDQTPLNQVALFLGSNLGNLNEPAAIAFLSRIRQQLRQGDRLLLGLDLKKDPQTILNAYNDTQGVTAAFNLNLLKRLNRELGMNFDPEQFSHFASYSPLDGAARSFLISKKRQRISSTVLARDFTFQSGESIYTEMSQKYSRAMIEQLCTASGFELKTLLTDSKAWYTVAVCQAAN